MDQYNKEPTQDDLLRIEVENGKILQKKYGFDEDTVVNDYELVIAEMGLSGNPLADMKTLQNSEQEIYERSGRYRKATAEAPISREYRDVPLDERGQDVSDRMNMGFVQSKYRNLNAAVTEGIHTLMAGTIETAALLPRKKDFGGHEAMTDAAQAIRDERDFKAAESAEFYLKPREHETLSGKVVAAAPSVGAAMIHPATIFPLLFEEGTSFAEEAAGKKFSEMSKEEQRDADLMRVTYTGVGGVLEKFGLGKMTKNLFKGGAKKAVLNTLEAAVVEGTTEASQQRLLRGLSKYIQDSDVEIFEADTIMGMAQEFFTSDEFKVGAILGGGARGGLETTTGIYEKFLSPDTAATRADFDALGETSTQEVIKAVLDNTNGDMEAAELAARAKNGDEEARKAYVESHYIPEGEENQFTGIMSPDEEAAINFQRDQELDSEAEGQASKIEEERSESAVTRRGMLDAVEFFADREQEGSHTEIVETENSLKLEINERLNEGMKPEEVEAWAYKKMIAAGISDPSKADPARLRIFGSNETEFRNNVFTDVSRIYEGANPLDVFEEKSHGYYERMLHEGEITEEQVLGWKAEVESLTGKKTHENDSDSLKEWAGLQSRAYAAGEAQAGNHSMPRSFREFLDLALEYFNHVLEHATRLMSLREQGLLGEDFETFLKRSTGLDEDYLADQAQREAETESFIENGEKLSEVIKTIKIPTPDADPSHRGELETLRESFGKRWSSVASKTAKLDDMAKALYGLGFSTMKTPADVLGALDSVSRGEEVYGVIDSRSAVEQRDASFSMRSTETPQFKEWFGDSKVVDENGEPLVVYRGDRIGKDVFTGREDKSNYLQGNVFFSSNADVGKFYTRHRTNYLITGKDLDESDGLYRVHLRIENPLIVDGRGEGWADIPTPDEIRANYEHDDIQIDDLGVLANQLGYDGLIVKNVYDQGGFGDQYAVFNPEQIKSATDNNGNFDGNDPRISFSMRPVIDGTVESFYDLETKQTIVTGEPVEVRYVHNPEPSPYFGNEFGQDYEPAGKYFTPIAEETPALDHLEEGRVRFESPLVLEWTGYGEDGWKQRLSDAYGGLSGLDLSNAVISSGYDGIITVSDVGGSGQYATESVDLKSLRNDPRISFSMREGGNLVTVHNLSEENLAFTIENLGSLPAPSLAVVRTDISDFTGFGDISLIAPPSLIDPSASRRNRVFNADAYTPRFPNFKFHPSDDSKGFVLRDVAEEMEFFNKGRWDIFEAGFEDEGLRAFQDNPVFMLKYLHDQGKTQKTLMTERPAVPKELRKFKPKAGEDLDWRIEETQRFKDAVIAMKRRELEDYRAAGKGQVADLFEERWFDESGDLWLSEYSKAWTLLKSGVKPKQVDSIRMRAAMRRKINFKKFTAWLKDRYGDVEDGKRIFDGFTPSGNRKYLPFNLKTVLRLMTREVAGAEGFNYGVGSIRANAAIQFKSLKQIKEHRDKIVTGGELEAFKKEAEQEFNAVIEELAPFYQFDKDSYQYLDSVSEALQSLAKGNRREWGIYYKEVDTDVMEKVSKFLLNLRNAPTEYFEVKIGDAVPISSFAAAVVPHDATKEIKAMLRSKGVKVRLYDRRQEGNRQEVVQSAAKSVGASFSMRESDVQDETFYSQLERVLSTKLQGKAASVQQVKGLLSPKHGVKPDEVKWSGIEQWLDDNADAKGKVSTAELHSYLQDAGRVKFEEVTRGVKDGYENAKQQLIEDGNWIPETEQVLNDWRDGQISDSDMESYLGIDLEYDGSSQYSQYVLPNGENYREVVLTMPKRVEIPEGYTVREQGDKWIALSPSGSPAWLDTEQEAISWANSHAEGLSDGNSNSYTSSHFNDIPNYVAHMRLNEREDSEGNEGLFIEEIQSDRHQAGREQGYKGDIVLPKRDFRIYEEIQSDIDARMRELDLPDGTAGGTRARLDKTIDSLMNELEDPVRMQKESDRSRAEINAASGIADAPFRKDWHLQMFKRALRDAVASGKDWIGWTKGKVHSDRWGTERIEWAKQSDGSFLVNAKQQHGGQAGGVDLEAEANSRNLNKENSEAVTTKAEFIHAITPALTEGQDPQALGKKLWGRMQDEDSGVSMPRKEGLESFYDKMLPAAVQKYVKKFGAKVEAGQLPDDGRTSPKGFTEFLSDDGLIESELSPRLKSVRLKAYDEYLASFHDDSAAHYHKVEITDAMRESVQKGQPSFSMREVLEYPEKIPFPARTLDMDSSARRSSLDEYSNQKKDREARLKVWSDSSPDTLSFSSLNLRMLVSKSSKPEYPWQMSVFDDEFNPLGHSERKTKFEAIQAAEEQGGVYSPKLSFSMREVEGSKELTLEEATKEERAYAQAKRDVKLAGTRTPESRQALRELRIKAMESKKRDRLKKSAARKLEKEVRRRMDLIVSEAEKRKNVEESIKSLEELVHALPVEVRGKFKGFGTLATKKGEAAQQRFLQSATSRVQDIFDNYLVKENRKKLRKVLKGFTSKSKGKRLKISQRMGKETRDAMTLAVQVAKYDKDIAKPNGMDQATYDAILSTFSGTLYAPDKLAARKIAEALLVAETMIYEGRFEIQEFQDARRAENEARVESAIDTVSMGDDIPNENQMKARDLKKSNAARGLEHLRFFLFDALNGLQNHMNMLDGERQGGLEKSIFLPAQVAKEEEGTLQRNHLEQTWDDNIDLLGGDHRKVSAWMKEAEEVVPTDIAFDMGDGMETVELSIMQGVDILNQWGDKSLRSTFEKMGIDEGMIAKVRDFVGENGVILSEYLRSRYAEVGLSIQETHRDTEGWAMDLVEGYGGKVRRANVKTAEEDSYFEFDKVTGRATVKTGSFKARSKNVNPIVWDNALDKFLNHMQESNHYISHAKIAKTLSSTFGKDTPASQKLRRAIIDKHGKPLMNAIDENIERVIGGGFQQSKKMWGAFDRLRSGLTKGTLMAKPDIMVKQLTSAPAFTEEVGVAAYGKAWLETMSDPVRWSKVVYETNFVKNRLSNSQFADVQDQINMRRNSVKKMRWDDLLMINVKAGDIGAIIMGGTPVYVHYYNQGRAEGKSEAQAHEYAELMFGASADRAQQASSEVSKGFYLGSSNFGIGRSFFMYLTSPMQYQRNVNVSIYNLYKGYAAARKGKNVNMKKLRSEAARALVVYHVILPQVFQAIASGLTMFSDDDDVVELFWARQRRALLLGNANVFPAVGSLLSSLANSAVGLDSEDFFGSSGSPLIDSWHKVTARADKAASEPSASSIVDFVAEAAQLKGIPMKQAIEQYEAFEDILNDDTEFPLQRALGWSPWALGEKD